MTDDDRDCLPCFGGPLNGRHVTVPADRRVVFAADSQGALWRYYRREFAYADNRVIVRTSAWLSDFASPQFMERCVLRWLASGMRRI